MKQNKTIIIHDTFLYKGGGERLILMMAKSLGADLASGFFSKGSFDLRAEGFEWKMIPVSSEIFAKGFRHLKLKQAFLYNTKFLSEYDTVIFSGDCLAAVKNCRADAKKIYYCHTPPRYLYDLKELYLKKIPFFMRPAFGIVSYIFRKMYELDIKQFDKILVNSENTGKRLKKFIGYDSQVLYPPVELDRFTWWEQGDYYISASRLSSAKRIDNIVQAFLQMPDKKLVVIYWENDPQKDEIFQLAGNAKNIQFITCPGNVWFTDYIGNSIAGICIPIDEDFGMTPVESMAAGKPVIWVDEGWIKESVIDGKTGFLIPEGWSVEDLIEAVEKLTPELALSMRSDCEKRSEDFSIASFEKQLRNHVNLKENQY